MDESDEQASDLFQWEELYQAVKMGTAGQGTDLDAAEKRLSRNCIKESHPAVGLHLCAGGCS
ncbi:hypothetical protein EVA_19632, partial [gut metagenome]